MVQIKRSICALAVTAIGFAITGPSYAQSLQVSPVVVDLPAPASSSLITVMNSGAEQIVVQARVFRWTQRNGQDVLEKTGNVVVSPPFTTVKPGARHVVRVVRVSTEAVSAEETYRILLDETPGRQKAASGAVALVVRHSVPVFFARPEARPGDLRWTATREKGGVIQVQASNPGQKRVKLTNLRIADGKAKALLTASGLAGYILGGQTKTWSIRTPSTGGAATTLSIEAMSETGAIHAVAALAPTN